MFLFLSTIHRETTSFAEEPKKIEWFPPLAGGTYRRGDKTLAENCAFASETEPILCTLVRW